MAPRANWKGFLRLSLVTCPVALYPATSDSEKIGFVVPDPILPRLVGRYSTRAKIECRPPTLGCRRTFPLRVSLSGVRRPVLSYTHVRSGYSPKLLISFRGIFSVTHHQRPLNDSWTSGSSGSSAASTDLPLSLS